MTVSVLRFTRQDKSPDNSSLLCIHRTRGHITIKLSNFEQDEERKTSTLKMPVQCCVSVARHMPYTHETWVQPWHCPPKNVKLKDKKGHWYLGGKNSYLLVTLVISI